MNDMMALPLERNLSAFLLGIDKDVFVQVQWRKIAGKCSEELADNFGKRGFARSIEQIYISVLEKESVGG